MKYVFKLSYLIFIISIFIGCSSSDTISNGIQTQPKNEQSYIDSITSVYGNKNSDIVIIDLQGGPVLSLSLEPYEDILQVDASSMKTLTLFQQSMHVVVHQHQTKYPQLYTKNDITFEQAKKYGFETTKMTAKVIQHYKQMGKKVYVIGTSYGAFLAQDVMSYIHNTDSMQPDGYMIVVGRLDAPKEFWEPFSQGRYMIFVNGETLRPTSDVEYAGMGVPGNAIASRNTARLAAGFGHKRYTQVLSNIPFNNVLYVYGEKDEQVGRLSASEVEFLEKKGAKVQMVENASHEEAAQSFFISGIDFLLKNEL